MVFRHPGVVVGPTQLQHAKRMVAAGEEPWNSAYRALLKSRYASLDYTAHPADVVPCPVGAEPRPCLDERQDAIAAYTHALLWSVNGRTAHARKAVEIMDGWSAVMKRHTGDNAGLQAARSGSTWARAAEIVHAGYPDWGNARVTRFKEMLRTAHLPAVRARPPAYDGARDLPMTDAAMGIAVFLEDRAVFRESVERFRDRVPAYFRLKKDGPAPAPALAPASTPLPVAPPRTGTGSAAEATAYRSGRGVYADGVARETCRGLAHVGQALAASAHIAETAWHQGVDLYGEQGERLKAALEFHAKYQSGEDPAEWPCGGGGEVDRTMGPDLEVALRHYEVRTGAKLPYTRALVEKTRPAGTDGLSVAWETLSHGEAAPVG
ncbi:hypothetical protein SAVIM338S_05874 [Streptomyces avidinii]